MRIAAALASAAVVAVGAYLVEAEGGWAATGYALAVGALVVWLTLRQLDEWLPTPEPARPLLRLVARRRPPPPPRPSALLDWEAALATTRVHGSADSTVRARITPLVVAHLRERRRIEPGDDTAVEVLGPTWERLRPGAPVVGSAARGPSLDELDDLTRRLEAL